MHDRNELCLELGLHIMGNMLDSGGDGVVSHEGGVHNHAEAFYLQVGLVQGFEWASVIEVVVEWDGEMGISDSGD